MNDDVLIKCGVTRVDSQHLLNIVEDAVTNDDHLLLSEKSVNFLLDNIGVVACRR